ncbi:hypothetical protein SDRG_10231 [Saprolegnia diclina VS20]|uniref:ELMO domain-containing protein n=1 Tax=Saprolegnia diclina (strain VS20) TaxID=1156394 RepID=T0RPW7_SAPDV|nr:hypothetical protein SDRG_10231 [Saprolegnia diclina VS20]EQC32032.1 hypothetical protein SDRG_10231 [Saprolegnia diclina VS20]|eukprot:XP_008614434.1 hypothetical protein SDRG_10231 [Saprolegnia diclina VS20]
METQSRSVTKAKSRKAKRGKKAGSPKHETAGDDDGVRAAETTAPDDADEFFDADASIVESPADVEVEAEPTIRHLGSDDGTYFDTLAGELAAHEADDADETLMDAVAADAEASAESEAADEPIFDAEANEATDLAEEPTEDAPTEVTSLDEEAIADNDAMQDGDDDAGALEACDVASTEPSTEEAAESTVDDTDAVADEALPSTDEADDAPFSHVVTDDTSPLETVDAVEPIDAPADDDGTLLDEAAVLPLDNEEVIDVPSLETEAAAPSLEEATDEPPPVDNADDSNEMETLEDATDAIALAECEATDEGDVAELLTLDDTAATDVSEAQDSAVPDAGTEDGNTGFDSEDAPEAVAPEHAVDDTPVENSEGGDDGQETLTMSAADETTNHVVAFPDSSDEATAPVDDVGETDEVASPAEEVLEAAESIADGLPLDEAPGSDVVEAVAVEVETSTDLPVEPSTVDEVETMVAPLSMDDDEEEDAVVPPPAPVDAPRPVTERLLSSKTQFEGVLNPGHDSESDSEDDDADATPVPEPLNLRATVVDDDELEVNVEIAQTITKAAPANPLAAAMATAVAETAMVPETAVATDSIAFSAFDEPDPSASADVFGIAYEKVQRPTAAATAGYSIGDGFDEPDVPLYSAKSTRDDSGADDFEVVELQPSQVLDVEKTRAALQARDEASERALLEQMQAATRAERSQNARSDTPVFPATANDGSLATGPTVLAEMHDMYKRGLGDQEVAQITNTAASPAPSHELLEEDEDAMDEEDDRERRALAQQRQEEMAHEAEWEHLQTFQDAPREVAFRVIKWNEALEHFGSSSYCLAYREAIVVADDSGRTGCFACFRGPTLAFPMASNQRELLFCIAMCSFNSAIPEHYRMLQTVYQKITHCRNECPLTGSHWEVLGFQGNDPATDLRGAGMLSLLQVLYLIENHYEILAKFHYASKHEEHHFPMMCVLINMTLHTMLALRSGALIPACNRHKDVAAGMNQLYVSMVVKLLSEWQTKACADAAFPMVMKDVLDLGKDNPLRLIAEMEHVIRTLSHRTTATTSPDELDGEVVDFTDIE